MSKLAGALVAGVGLAALIRSAWRRPLPRPGLVRIAGLDEEIEILRDRWGVPNIYARTEHDLFFANGLVHAEDRLWQMELQRRAAAGRLSEIFGARTIEVDRFMRRIGLSRVAAAEELLLDEETRTVLGAYAAGVNWVIEARPRPLELLILRHRPEPWRIQDSLAWSKLMGWGLSVNWDTELARAKLGQRLDPETAARIDPLYPVGGWLTAAGRPMPEVDSSILESYRLVRDITGLGTLGGSNAWAVGPGRSTTGRALLANDIHLAPQMPSVCYELSLDSTDASGNGYRAAGMSFPGLPIIVIGHNQHIAWGITASLADVQDVFVERPDPSDPRRFARGDGWEEVTIVREEIRVKGQKGWVTEDIAVSSNGPVLTPLLMSAMAPLSLRAPMLEPSGTISAAIRLNRARNWDEFRGALRGWAAPSLSFVYADVEGNIGYQLAGQVPRRGKGDGSVPVPGWDPEYGWDGIVPFEELPTAFNPAEGFIATANNRLVGADYPYKIGCDWSDSYRIGRIVELLRSRERHDRDSFAAIQQDLRSNAARDFITRVRSILADEQPIDPLERTALGTLLDWDGELSADSAAAAIYEHMRARLLKLLYAPALGDLVDVYLGSQAHRFTGLSSFAWRASSLLMTALDDPDWPALCGHRGLSWRDLLMVALGDGVSELRVQHGENAAAWRWGTSHALSFEHPLGQMKPLNRVFNRGPYPVGGDVDTPKQIGAVPWRIPGNPAWIPAYRQIVDLGDMSRSISIHSTGQSGQPASPHYDDFVAPWLAGDYHPMLWERAEIEAHLASETRLIPIDELSPKRY